MKAYECSLKIIVKFIEFTPIRYGLETAIRREEENPRGHFPLQKGRSKADQNGESCQYGKEMTHCDLNRNRE